MSGQSGTPDPGWYADPYSRHQHRYWDGSTWTDQVADAGQVSTDPPVETPAPAAQTPPTEPAPTDTVSRPVAATPPAPGTESQAAGGGGTKVPVVVLALVGLGIALVLVVVLVSGGGNGDTVSAGDRRSGSLSTPDSRDRYEIEGRESTVVIDVFGTADQGGLDPIVSVEEVGSGSRVGRDDDGGAGLDSRLEVFLESGQRYVIIVEGFGDTTGSYEIAVR